jgi:hypothetical protein
VLGVLEPAGASFSYGLTDHVYANWSKACLSSPKLQFLVGKLAIAARVEDAPNAKIARLPLSQRHTRQLLNRIRGPASDSLDTFDAQGDHADVLVYSVS